MNLNNLSYAWAKLIIHELIVNDVTDFVIAPGSRSAPLTIACAEDSNATTYVHLDERGVGFFALGLAKSKKQTIAIITTSGTAVANLYPAVIEAYMTNVPLIVISADRPLELYNSGANQTINQIDIFNRYAKCIQLSDPNIRVPINSLLNKIDFAIYETQTMSQPIQINCPLFKPLYPSEEDNIPDFWLKECQKHLFSTKPAEAIYGKQQFITETNSSFILEDYSNDDLILVIIGNGVPNEFHEQISSLTNMINAVVIADIQSNYTFDHMECHDLFIQSKAFLSFTPHIKLVIQFGERLISANIQKLKENLHATQISVSDHCKETDPSFRNTFHYIGIKNFLNKFTKQNVTSTDKSTQKETLKQLNFNFASEFRKLTDQCNSFDELSVASLISKHDNHNLFIGNSMCCRSFEIIGNCMSKQIFTNRGASGIDGILATACGIASHKGKITLVIGDISALHDLSSFILLQKYPVNVIIFNNKGGNIFSMLKNRQENPFMDQYFELSHNTQFDNIAHMFGINYRKIKNNCDFENLIQTEIYNNNKSLIIECDFKQDLGVQRIAKLKSILNEFQ